MEGYFIKKMIFVWFTFVITAEYCKIFQQSVYCKCQILNVILWTLEIKQKHSMSSSLCLSVSDNIALSSFEIDATNM